MLLYVLYSQRALGGEISPSHYGEKFIRNLTNDPSLCLGCGAPSNATTVWKKARELGLDIHKAVESASEVVPLVMGCDFLLYGLIESAPWIFPACAAVDAMITAVARAELGIKPLTMESPLYKLFPEFVQKLEKADL